MESELKSLKSIHIKIHSKEDDNIVHTGKMISMLLLSEDPEKRAYYLATAARILGITLKEFSDSYTEDLCVLCGLPKEDHKNDGFCPKEKT